VLDTYLKECLFFTANRLSRVVTKFVEDEFARCGLSPNGAFLLLAVLEEEGINQKNLGENSPSAAFDRDAPDREAYPQGRYS